MDQRTEETQPLLQDDLPPTLDRGVTISEAVTVDLEAAPTFQHSETMKPNITLTPRSRLESRKDTESRTISEEGGCSDVLMHISYVRDHYPKLNPEQVQQAAIEMNKIITARNFAGQVTGGVSLQHTYKDIFMFKSRPIAISNLLHFSIWCVAEFNLDPGIIETLLESLNEPNEVFEPACYSATSPDRFTFITAVHVAAGLGQLHILKLLTHYACNKTSPSARVTQDEYLDQWARHGDAGASAADFLDATQQHLFSKFYQPIHDSTFNGHGDVTLWLLRQKADPSSKNDRGITPLHFVAFKGIQGCMDAALEEDLKDIIRETRRKEHVVEITADMSRFIPSEGKKKEMLTPLEVAVADQSRYPQAMLGLLAPCLADGNHLKYFDDIRRIAEKTPEGALRLVRTIAEKSKRSQNTLKRFRMNAQMPGNSDVLASIFFQAPLAGAEMLELLEDSPELENPARHPIPTRTSMWGFFQDVQMRCSYQVDSTKKDGLLVPSWNWKEKEEPQIPPWHEELCPNSPKHARSAHIKNVRLVTSLLPGILDVDFLMSIARLQHEHLELMEKKSLQGAIFCMWNNLVNRVWLAELVFCTMDVVACIVLSTVVQSGGKTAHFSCCIVVAGALELLFKALSSFVTICCRTTMYANDMTMSQMWSPYSKWSLSNTIPDIMHSCMALWLVFNLTVLKDKHTRLDDVLLAACLLASCVRLIWSFRLQIVGCRLYTIVATCMAGAVSQIIFITLMLMISMVLAMRVLARNNDVAMAVAAYRGFLFGDGDGFDGIGMIGSHEDGNFALNTESTLLLVGIAGAFFFNVVVLNIIIAIYGNEYNKVQHETPWQYMRGRAEYCVRSILSFYIFEWKGEAFHRTLIFVSFILFALSAFFGLVHVELMWISPILMASGQVLLPVALMQSEWFTPDGNNAADEMPFLWMCFNQDAQLAAGWHDDESGESITAIMGMQTHMDEKIAHLSHNQKNLDEKLDEILKTLRVVSTATAHIERPRLSRAGSTEIVDHAPTTT